MNTSKEETGAVPVEKLLQGALQLRYDLLTHAAAVAKEHLRDEGPRTKDGRPACPRCVNKALRSILGAIGDVDEALDGLNEAMKHGCAAATGATDGTWAKLRMTLEHVAAERAAAEKAAEEAKGKPLGDKGVFIRPGVRPE